MFTIPSNILPILFIGILAILFGVKSLMYYKKLRSPLFGYFGWSTILFGLSSVFLALAYTLDPSSTALLKSLVTVSNILYIIALFVMYRIIWYLGFKKSISYLWMFIPVFILSSISLILDLVNRIGANYYLSENIAYYSASTISTYILAVLSLSIAVVGVLTIKEALEVNEKIQRTRIIVIGMMFLLSGLVVEYNFLFNNEENIALNTLFASMIVVITVGLLIFLVKYRTPDEHK
ncbi:MAG: hypothetical protein QG675_364 [Patescibacteria group bacterium]|jgi:hypothetical protein|nr:hypothetical protein [Patescibacteria group bacterium]